MENPKRIRLYSSSMGWIEKVYDCHFGTKTSTSDAAETFQLKTNNSQYVQVVSLENSESIDIPCEDDKTLHISVLTTYYPGAVGLKYFVDGRFRAVKLSHQKLYPPEDGWNGRLFICIYPQYDASKIEADDSLENYESETEELAVLGIPMNTTNTDLHDYFAKFGDLIFAEANSEKCRGFGIIKFANEQVQAQVISLRHRIHDQWCDVLVYKKATRCLLVNA